MTALHPRAQSAHIRSAKLGSTAMMFATSGQGAGKMDLGTAAKNGQDDAKKGMPGAGQDFSFPTTSKVDGLSPDHPMFAQVRPAMSGAHCH